MIYTPTRFSLFRTSLLIPAPAIKIEKEI